MFMLLVVACVVLAASVSALNVNRRPLFGGNWKLNPKNLVSATNLASDLVKLTKGVDGVDVVVFPPSPYLIPVHQQLLNSQVKLGAQDCHFENEGAFTGAVSTGILKDAGAQYILCGHSERRSLFGDSDEIISRKVKKVLNEGLIAVLCVGESQFERNIKINNNVVATQLLRALHEVSLEQMKRVVIAYEPVWAIGTGLVCEPSVAQQQHAFIRSLLAEKYGNDTASKVIIQYGGSVKSDNVLQLMMMPDVDGCLVGGASLTADSFNKIIRFQENNSCPTQ